jgi:hypothetical protein
MKTRALIIVVFALLLGATPADAAEHCRPTGPRITIVSNVGCTEVRALAQWITGADETAAVIGPHRKWLCASHAVRADVTPVVQLEPGEVPFVPQPGWYIVGYDSICAQPVGHHVGLFLEAWAALHVTPTLEPHPRLPARPARWVEISRGVLASTQCCATTSPSEELTKT